MRVNFAAALLWIGFLAAAAACRSSAQDAPPAPTVDGNAQPAAPASPAPQDEPEPTPTQDPRALRRANREKVKAAEADLAPHVETFGPHVVRVQTWYEIVSKRVDGVEYDRRRINGLQGNGIIVRADPLILVSGSIAEVDLPKLPDPVAPSPFSEISPDRYEILTRDNRVVPAEIVARDETMNLMLLRPVDPESAPAEWKIDLPIPTSGRPLESSYLGITLFADPYRDGSVNGYVVHVPNGKNSFRRPSLPGIGRFQLGMPLFDRGGALVAIVGIAPKSDPVPAWATDPQRRLERPLDRDPDEYENGRRKAVLMSIDEVRPVLERWFATNFGEAPFDLFGFALRDSSTGVHVTRVDRDGAAASGGLRVGDRVAMLDGIDTPTSDAFATALERRLADEPKTLRLAVVRGADALELEMFVP